MLNCRNRVSRIEIDVKILKPVYNGYRGSILVELVYTALFNKHLKMPNAL